MLRQSVNFFGKVSRRFASKKKIASFNDRLNQNVKKISHKETVSDLNKFKDFMDEGLNKNKLGNALNKTARHNDNFKDFLNDFKKKHPQYPNIVDMTRDKDQDNQKNLNKKADKYTL